MPWQLIFFFPAVLIINFYCIPRALLEWKSQEQAQLEVEGTSWDSLLQHLVGRRGEELFPLDLDNFVVLSCLLLAPPLHLLSGLGCEERNGFHSFFFLMFLPQSGVVGAGIARP